MALSLDEIYPRVTAILVASLNIDEAQIRPTSTLLGDLGAESIDFLDIVFRLEREFGLTISRAELFPEPFSQGDAQFVRDGRVTDMGLALLRERLPFAELAKLEHDPRSDAISDLFTVDMITRYVQSKLNQMPGVASGA